MRILICSDSYLGPDVFRVAFADLARVHDISYLPMDEDRRLRPVSASEHRIREYLGHPEQIAESLDRHDVLIVHGAPVTGAVMDACPQLRLIGCARGGPVNVDVPAATERGVPVVSAPGRNAESVADLTMAFLVMLARGVNQAQRRLAVTGMFSDSAYDGKDFLGRDLQGQKLGLVGFGRVAERVADRAAAFGMEILAFDPYRKIPAARQVTAVDRLDDLLGAANFVSLHARATRENENMLGAAAFARMRRGSWLVNTARETLVDEDSLYHALLTGQLAGAALDVLRPTAPDSRSPLLDLAQVIVTPHIGGATHETLSRGALMLAAEVARFAAGERLLNVINLPAVAVPAATMDVVAEVSHD
jgi:D-3-phosphoglycerate dehydrogenase / 2-oxoglutarate reductase